MAPAAALPGPWRGPDSDTRRTAHAGRKPAPGPKRGRRGGPVSFHTRPGVPAASRTGRRVTRGRAATSGGTPPGRGAAARAPSRWRGARAGKRATRHTANRAERYEASPDLPYLWHVRSGSRLVVGRAIRATTRRRVVIDRGHRRPYLCLLSRHSHVSANSRRGLHFHATCRVHGYTRLRLDLFDNGSIISMP